MSHAEPPIFSTDPIDVPATVAITPTSATRHEGPATAPDPSVPIAPAAPVAPADRRARLLGVDVTDVTRARAVDILSALIDQRDGISRCIYFVNAHTLNLACAAPDYRDVLGRAEYVFGDGTGVRWAARMRGVRFRDNLCGTDLIPALLKSAPSRSFFMLGADEPTIHRAARRAESRFPGWILAGFHHGYLDEPAVNDWAIEQINASRADVLLVGMGNPRQERWLDAHRDRLEVPVAIGVGGLFDFWAETVSRAPRWLRRLGHEWIWRLLQQPRDKACRYLIGNPVFLARALGERLWAR